MCAGRAYPAWPRPSARPTLPRRATNLRNAVLRRGAGLPHSRWLCCGDEVGLQLRDELGEFDHAWGRGWAGCVGGAALVLLRGKAAPSSIRWQASRPVIGPARQHYYW